MPPPIVVQIRLTADSFSQAEQASAELIAQLGTARVMLQLPREGRDKKGDGNPPWFVYGTFQFVPELENDYYRPPPTKPSRSVVLQIQAQTGPTKPLLKPPAPKRPRKRP